MASTIATGRICAVLVEKILQKSSVFFTSIRGSETKMKEKTATKIPNKAIKSPHCFLISSLNCWLNCSPVDCENSASI